MKEEEEKRERGRIKEGKLIPIIFTLLLHLGNIGMHRLFKASLHLQTPTLHQSKASPCFWKT